MNSLVDSFNKKISIAGLVAGGVAIVIPPLWGAAIYNAPYILPAATTMLAAGALYDLFNGERPSLAKTFSLAAIGTSTVGMLGYLYAMGYVVPLPSDMAGLGEVMKGAILSSAMIPVASALNLMSRVPK